MLTMQLNASTKNTGYRRLSPLGEPPDPLRKPMSMVETNLAPS